MPLAGILGRQLGKAAAALVPTGGGGGANARIGTLIRVEGLPQARRAVRRLEGQATRAHAAALRKVLIIARGRVRRAIAGMTGTPLKLTRKRVAWFWKTRRGTAARPPVAKLWVGTRYAVGAAELPRLDREPKGQRSIDLYPAAARVLRPISESVMRREYRRQVRSQYARFARVRAR